MTARWMNACSVGLVFVAVILLAGKNYDRNFGSSGLKILNVSYDPTRELYTELNAKFAATYAAETGTQVAVSQSHGGSSKQAREVAAGLAADVVTLALPSDVEFLEKRGLIPSGWADLYPNHSQPYFSTIVFVVRKNNPKEIRDWPDLVRPGVEIVTPNPKTSGNGKLSFLAAWGSVIHGGGTEEQAHALVDALYRNVVALGNGARDSATAFALGNVGDVHLAWENEAFREVADSKGELAIVYPSASIRAEPSVAVVPPNTTAHHTEAAAKAYLAYLFTDEAQEIIAHHGYRPISEKVSAGHRSQFAPIELFPITLIARDWSEAETHFFAENGVYSALEPKPKP